MAVAKTPTRVFASITVHLARVSHDVLMRAARPVSTRAFLPSATSASRTPRHMHAELHRHDAARCVTDTAEKERQLQGLWSCAYDGWIDVPRQGDETETLDDTRTSTGVVYLRPAPTTVAVSRAALLPRVATTSRALFALTGFNPMGCSTSLSDNRAANAQLSVDIRNLTHAPTHVWAAFGFAEEWREDGFVLAYGDTNQTSTADADADDARTVAAAEAAVVELARKYKQGAIYAYRYDANTGALMRRTVPAAMSSAVEADVAMELCAAPPLRCAAKHPPDDAYVNAEQKIETRSTTSSSS